MYVPCCKRMPGGPSCSLQRSLRSAWNISFSRCARPSTHTHDQHAALCHDHDARARSRRPCRRAENHHERQVSQTVGTAVAGVGAKRGAAAREACLHPPKGCRVWALVALRPRPTHADGTPLRCSCAHTTSRDPTVTSSSRPTTLSRCVAANGTRQAGKLGLAARHAPGPASPTRRHLH